MQQLMHQRGDEHGLARAGQAGDAEPDGRVEQVRTELAEGARGEPDFFGDVGEGGHEVSYRRAGIVVPAQVGTIRATVHGSSFDRIARQQSCAIPCTRHGSGH